MRRVRCCVCDKKSATLEHRVCALCMFSFFLCGKCELLGRDYVPSPQPRPDYCPHCNERFKAGEPEAVLELHFR